MNQVHDTYVLQLLSPYVYTSEPEPHTHTSLFRRFGTISHALFEIFLDPSRFRSSNERLPHNVFVAHFWYHRTDLSFMSSRLTH